VVDSVWLGERFRMREMRKMKCGKGINYENERIDSSL